MNTAKITPDAKAKLRFFIAIGDNFIPNSQQEKLFPLISSADKKQFKIDSEHSYFDIDATLDLE